MRKLRHAHLLVAFCLLTSGCQVEYELPTDLPKMQLEQDREMHEIRKRELDLTYERMLRELNTDLASKGTSADAKEAAVTSLRNEWTAKKQELAEKFKSAHPSE